MAELQGMGMMNNERLAPQTWWLCAKGLSYLILTRLLLLLTWSTLHPPTDLSLGLGYSASSICPGSPGRCRQMKGHIQPWSLSSCLLASVFVQ